MIAPPQPPSSNNTACVGSTAEPDECSICLESIKNEKHLVKTCQSVHTFHDNCLKKWLKTVINDRQMTTCPACRHDFTSKREEYDQLMAECTRKIVRRKLFS